MAKQVCSKFTLDLCAAQVEMCKCGFKKSQHQQLSAKGSISEKDDITNFKGEFLLAKGTFSVGDIVHVTKIGNRYHCRLEERNKEEAFTFASLPELNRTIRLEEIKPTEVPKRPAVVVPAPKPVPVALPKPVSLNPSPWYDDFKKARDFWNKQCLRNNEVKVAMSRKYRIEKEPGVMTEKEMRTRLSDRRIDRTKTRIQLVNSKTPWPSGTVTEYFPEKGTEFNVPPTKPKRNAKGTTKNAGWIFLDAKNAMVGPVEGREMIRMLDDGAFAEKTTVCRVGTKEFVPITQILNTENGFVSSRDPEWLLGGRGFSKTEEVSCFTCKFPNLSERFICCVCRQPIKPVPEFAQPSVARATSTNGTRQALASPSPNAFSNVPAPKEGSFVVPGHRWEGPRPAEPEGYVMKVFPETGECRVGWGKTVSKKHSYANGEVVIAPPKTIAQPESSRVSAKTSTPSVRSTSKASTGESVSLSMVSRFFIVDVASSKTPEKLNCEFALGIFKERAPLVLKDAKKLMESQSQSIASSLVQNERELCKCWSEKLCPSAGASPKTIDGFKLLEARYKIVLDNLWTKFKLQEMSSSSEEQRLLKRN